MKHATISYVLNVEQQAREMVSAARQKIEDAKQRARQEAVEKRNARLEAARAKADSIRDEGDAQAEEIRSRILGEAESEAKAIEAKAGDYQEAAVAFVVDRILGRV